MEQIEPLEDVLAKLGLSRDHEVYVELSTREQKIIVNVIEELVMFHIWSEERARRALVHCGLLVPPVGQQLSEAQQEALGALVKAKEANDAALAAILSAANRISDL